MNITITPVCAGKPWNGASIHEGPLGGSETAALCLGREFAARNHNVVMFTHGQPGSFEGVVYRHVSELMDGGLPGGTEVHISSRWVDILLRTPPEVTRVLWVHDVPPQVPVNIPADLIVALSRFQAHAWQLYDGWPEDRLLICGDGVTATNFAGFEVRDENKLIWTSNPDRGLYIAAKIFREQVHPRWPDLRLVVYGSYGVYGWPKEQERPFQPPIEWQDEGWLEMQEPLPHLALARELMGSFAMWYPTWWPETFCMAALESQMAGTPVITTNVGALPETIIGGIVCHTTDELVNAVSQLRNANRWNKLSEAGKEFAQGHSWPEIAAAWERAIHNVQEMED